MTRLPAVSPRADCSTARSRAAELVCLTPSLARLDAEARGALAAVAGSGEARLTEKAAKSGERFARRLDRCDDEACVERLYVDRIGDLNKLARRAETRQQQERRSEGATSALAPCKGFQVYRPSAPCHVVPKRRSEMRLALEN